MNKGVKTTLLVVMDLLFVLAALDVVRLVVLFFGSLASGAVGGEYVELTRYLVIPIGIEPYATPYGGFFDMDTTLTVVGMLILEWILGMVRRGA